MTCYCCYFRQYCVLVLPNIFYKKVSLFNYFNLIIRFTLYRVLVQNNALKLHPHTQNKRVDDEKGSWRDPDEG